MHQLVLDTAPFIVKIVARGTEVYSLYNQEMNEEMLIADTNTDSTLLLT